MLKIITKTSTGTWYQINGTTFVFEGVSEPPTGIAWVQQGYDLVPYSNDFIKMEEENEC